MSVFPSALREDAAGCSLDDGFGLLTSIRLNSVPPGAEKYW